MYPRRPTMPTMPTMPSPRPRSRCSASPSASASPSVAMLRAAVISRYHIRPLLTNKSACLQILEEGKAFELGTSLMPRLASPSRASASLRAAPHPTSRALLTASPHSRPTMASRLLPLPHLRHPPRHRCQPSPPRRRLPHLQQLYIHMQRLRQQD